MALNGQEIERSTRPSANLVFLIESILIERPYTGMTRDCHAADADFRFAAAVAMTAFWLRDPEGGAGLRLESAAAIAREALGSDPHGRRAEFVGLLDQLGGRW